MSTTLTGRGSFLKDALKEDSQSETENVVIRIDTIARHSLFAKQISNVMLCQN